LSFAFFVRRPDFCWFEQTPPAAYFGGEPIAVLSDQGNFPLLAQTTNS
jgi:hypothetical protein